MKKNNAILLNPTLKLTKVVIKLSGKTFKTIFVVLTELIKLMVQGMIDVTEWFYNTVGKVVKVAYSK